MPIVFCVESVAGVFENGLLSLYSMRAPSRGGNHDSMCLLCHVTMLLELNVTRLVCVIPMTSPRRFCTVCHLHICLYFD